MKDSATRFVDDLLDRMTPGEKLGQLVMALNAPDRPDTSDPFMLVRERAIGAVISTAYRSLNPRAAVEHNNRLQQAALDTRLGIPLLNGGDFEQGLASIMGSDVTGLPHQMGLAAARDPSAARDAAAIAAGEARALGFNWTFVPDLDVNTRPANPVIGVRSFGDDPDLVSSLGASQILAYQSGGVLATAKHFPGHGATSLDSHLDLPKTGCDLSTPHSVHVAPFLAAIRTGVASVMTAHVIVPELDPRLPATLSPRVLTDFLREQLEFDGIVITDLMSMNAIADRWSPEESAILAVEAGADVVLAATSTSFVMRSLAGLRAALHTGRISRDRIDASVRRILRAKHRLGLFDEPFAEADRLSESVATRESVSRARELGEQSVTLLANTGAIPYDASTPARTLVAGTFISSATGRTRVEYVSTVAEAVAALGSGPVATWIGSSFDPSEEETATAAERGAEVDRIIVLTYSRGLLTDGQAKLVGALDATGRPVVAIAIGTPYDLLAYPEVGAALACYALEFVPVHLACAEPLQAAVRAVFGGPAPGLLPVRLGAHDR